MSDAVGADKYHGDVAEGYDKKRLSQMKFHNEQAIITSMLADLSFGASILDVPVGTGRFISTYLENGFNVIGMDLSEDMLAEARKKAGSAENIALKQGSVLDLPFGDRSFDVALMIRLTRWLSPEECVTAIHELTRVAKRRVIFTARVRNHPHARPYDLFKVDGWTIARDEEADGPDYRVIMMEPG